MVQEQSYYPKQKSGAQRGLEEKMEYWKQKDVLTEFNILTAQSVNLAVELLNGKTEGIEEAARKFFVLLLKLRKDEDLKAKFKEYKNQP